MENASHGREKLLEVIHQSEEIKKRKKSKSNSKRETRKTLEFPSKKSSDSDSSDDKTVRRPDGTIIHSQSHNSRTPIGHGGSLTGRSLEGSFSSMIVTENTGSNRDNGFNDFINDQKYFFVLFL